MAPNSQDLNSVDYAAWGAFQQMVYQRRRNTTINQLKQAIVIEWGKLSQRFIDRAIGQWRRGRRGLSPSSSRKADTLNI